MSFNHMKLTNTAHRTAVRWLATLALASGAAAVAQTPAAPAVAPATPTPAGAAAATATPVAAAPKAALPITPLAQLRTVGSAMMRFLGLDIYRAQLWVHPDFVAEQYTRHPLALELTYQRSFSAHNIAKRSLQEMRRVGSFTDEQAERWQTALQAALPDVQPGDRLLGHYQPGVGAVFQMQGKRTGEINDPAFAALFFGIWLSPKTSEPALREALLTMPAGRAAP